MNTELRAAATDDADKDMYLLLNNAVFGTTCESLFKRTDYRLVSSRKEALKFIAKPTFRDYIVYNEKLAGIHLDPSSVTLNKPSYVGVAVLELSKVYMYRFHYEEVKARYGESAQNLFTRTPTPSVTSSRRGIGRRHSRRRSDEVRHERVPGRSSRGVTQSE